jgi:hypothetical protein
MSSFRQNSYNEILSEFSKAKTKRHPILVLVEGDALPS